MIAVPSPGYTTSKKLMPAIRDLIRNLGTQDACVQLQELAIRHLETDANARGELSGEFLMEAFADYRISHGTYDFDLSASYLPRHTWF